MANEHLFRGASWETLAAFEERNKDKALQLGPTQYRDGYDLRAYALPLVVRVPKAKLGG